MSRHQLGNDLRRLRLERLLRLEDVAASLGVAPSTLSRIETGKAPAKAEYLKIMFDIYDIHDPEQCELLRELAANGQRKSQWTGHHDLLTPGEAQYLDPETAATQIRAYAVHAVPGPLQTHDYATAALHAARPDLAPEQVRTLAAIQQRRHAHMLRQGTQLHLIIDESVLLRCIGTENGASDQGLPRLWCRLVWLLLRSAILSARSSTATGMQLLLQPSP